MDRMLRDYVARKSVYEVKDGIGAVRDGICINC